jgi:hypothetical protein
LQKPKFSEIVEVRLGDGSIRKGQVLEVDGTRAVVQVRGSCRGGLTGPARWLENIWVPAPPVVGAEKHCSLVNGGVARFLCGGRLEGH